VFLGSEDGVGVERKKGGLPRLRLAVTRAFFVFGGDRDEAAGGLYGG
jgi:hypothetical protein